MSRSSVQRRARVAPVSPAGQRRAAAKRRRDTTKRLRRFALVLALITQATACAAGPLPPDARNATLSTRLAGDDARRAQRLAPDLYARAERAAQDARDSRDGAERSDHAARADLLLQAAIAEADRVQAERSAAAADARAESAVEQRAELERERLEVERTEQRELAARSARSEAERAFRSALRGGASIDDASATWLVDRAALTLAAAIALGLPAQRAAEIERAINGTAPAPADRTRRTAARLAAAERVLSDAERALGQARKQHAVPTSEEVAALLAMATERGLPAHSDARGVVIGLDAAFTVGSAAPTAQGVRLLAALAALARAFPHGAIQLETRADAAENSLADRGARARLERVRTALVADTEPARIARTTAPADDAGGDQFRIVFAAYVLGPAKTP